MTIDGKLVARKIKDNVSDMVRRMKRPPKLAVIAAGHDPASAVYVRSKEKACKECGIDSIVIRMDEASQEEVIKKIHELNYDPSVDGILVQLPLPDEINERAVISEIEPCKDVDGLHPLNVGKMQSGMHGIVPCTPAGIMEILKYYDIPIDGKRCCVIGRSNLVGRPIAYLMDKAEATVTLCHSHTRSLAEEAKRADILIVAAGKKKLITADMVKDGAVVIDIGINRDDNGKLCGDVDFENVKDKASYITPVPNGVGAMTVAMLMLNVAQIAARKD